MRLLSKSMQLLDVQAELSGKGGKMEEIQEGLKRAKESEKTVVVKRDEMRERMREMLKEKEGKKK